MIKSKNFPVNTSKIIKILRLFVIIGWLAFFVYDLYLVRYLGNQYYKDPSNFIMFDDEQHRQAYKSRPSFNLKDEWIDQASLRKDCRPLDFINDFYFDKVDRFIKLSCLLLLLTLISRLDPAELKRWGAKIGKISDKIED